MARARKGAGRRTAVTPQQRRPDAGGEPCDLRALICYDLLQRRDPLRSSTISAPNAATDNSSSAAGDMPGENLNSVAGGIPNAVGESTGSSSSSPKRALKRPRLEQPLLGQAFHDHSVIAVIVVTGPNSLPSPRCRLPAPARAAIETNAGDERHGREGEAAMVEPIEPGERKPIDAWCKSWSEREAA